MTASPVLPLLDPTSGPLMPSLVLLGPVLIPSGLANAIIPFLPLGSRYFIQSAADDDVLGFLDAGAERVVVALDHLKGLEGVPAERLIVELELSQIGSLPKGASPLIKKDEPVSRKALGIPESTAIYVQSTSPASSNPDTTLIIPTSHLSTGASSSQAVSITDLFISRLVSDRPDGLYPTIVTSAENGRCLGMVYSSKESIAETIATRKGVYQSRKHGLWRKGETSGATQDVISIAVDCDSDALLYSVIQHGSGFCHLPQPTCFGQLDGLAKLESTLKSRKESAPEGSYTKRLFTDEKLLRSKIMEEAEELCDAESKGDVAFEAADLIYFALARCVSKGVSLRDVEDALDKKSLKVSRRKGDAKPKWDTNGPAKKEAAGTKREPVPADFPATDEVKMRTVRLSQLDKAAQAQLLQRPVLNSLAMIEKVKPIMQRVRDEGDAGLKAMTKQFDKADLSSNVMLPPYATPSEQDLPPDVRAAIDRAYTNVKTFHAAQAEKAPLRVETMPGVVCSRFVRPIARVGIYVPGGTAILPSTAIMLGVPAQVAGCKEIVLATPPRPDGSISPEVLYVAQLTGVTCILKAGGAQSVAAMAFGTDEVPKVDKIFGPGNQWVTAAKLAVSIDSDAQCAIDMPAGPSEVLVIADSTANPAYVASDLLSQAEHGIDSQVVLVAIKLSSERLAEIEKQIEIQARALPRSKIAIAAIKLSLIIIVDTLEEGVAFSNEYAPEHLILQLQNAPDVVKMIDNAGSIFVGQYSPESFGDYASGTNHTLPTASSARQFSGVNTLSFQKHITSQEITKEGLAALGPTVITLAEREDLEGHANAVRLRLADLK